VAFEDDARVVHVLAHKVLGPLRIACEHRLDDAVMITVRSLDQSMVTPKHDASRGVRNLACLLGKA
jgi:hypothetical protein